MACPRGARKVPSVTADELQAVVRGVRTLVAAEPGAQGYESSARWAYGVVVLARSISVASG